MDIDNEELKKAFDMWESFKHEVLHKNRFFVNHEVLDHLKHIADRNRRCIEKDTTLYRARIYVVNQLTEYLKKQYNESGNLTQSQKEGFWGFDANDSFIPQNSNIVNDGRANPAYIKYLYTAEAPYTALVEVRPYLNNKVSIAEIKVNEALEVADFSIESYPNFEGFEQCLMFLIMNDFSNPSASDKKGYIPTQYISEYIKTLGFDGIRFTSSLHSEGRNITIFNYEKCQAVGSKVYQLGDICFEANCVEPKNEKGLTHRKLEAYKGVQLNEILRGLIKQKEK